jgi:hypothetical protein
MQARGQGSRQALVLISDGVHNAGRLREPQRCFADNGWPVFTYSVGISNSGLLGRLATMTGGEARSAAGVFDPVCEMERLRSVMNGTPRSPCSRFLLRSGETLSVPLTVPPEQDQLALAVTWLPLGKGEEQPVLNTAVRLPGGGTLSAEAALSHDQESGGERYAISRPVSGSWEAVISGRGLPPAGVLVGIAFGTTPTAFVTAPEGEQPVPSDAPGGISLVDGTLLEDLTPEETTTPTPEASVEPTPSSSPAPRGRQTATPSPAPISPTVSPAPSP